MTNIIPLSLKPGWYILFKNGEPGMRTWQPFKTQANALLYLERRASQYNSKWTETMEVVEIKK